MEKSKIEDLRILVRKKAEDTYGIGYGVLYLNSINTSIGVLYSAQATGEGLTIGVSQNGKMVQYSTFEGDDIQKLTDKIAEEILEKGF